MSRRILFRREFLAYQGGHGKVWDYFRHASIHDGWRPLLHLTANSTLEGNPWRDIPAHLRADTWDPRAFDALFLGGIDWDVVPPDLSPRVPIINLIQHVRHADAGQRLYRYLSRPAIRICVSSEVARAILETGQPRGPVLVIDAAIDVPPLVPTKRPGSIVLAASKQPMLGRELRQMLSDDGWSVLLLDTPVSRDAFLHALAEADIAVTLPHEREGYYLPAIEAMALGCAVVVPDCIGNRAYLEPGTNALMPYSFASTEILECVRRLRDLGLKEGLRAAGINTAAKFTQQRERSAFHAVLDDMDSLWTNM